MRRSMAKLIAEKLIYRYNDEYKFFNPFFAQWLGRGRRPLRSIPRLANTHDSTLLRVESKNDFDTIFPHP